MKRLVLVSCLTACLPEQLDRCDRAEAGDVTECRVPDWLDRSFELRVPASWDAIASLPVVLVLHGGGGNRAIADKTTCPDGDTSRAAGDQR